MSQISLHTSRETTPSGETRAIWPLGLFVGIYGAFLVAFSIYLFMVNATSEKVNDLLTAQNAAALKLSTNVEYYNFWLKEKAVVGQPLPPGLFEDVVEFSRKNATLMKTVPRLTFLGFFSSPSLHHTLKGLSKLAPFVVDEEPAPPPDAHGAVRRFSHYGVSPRTDRTTIVNEAIYQIELYQAIRDYAQDKSRFDKGFFSALTIYLLPVAYALLGAFLYAFRSYCYRGRHQRRLIPLSQVGQYVV